MSIPAKFPRDLEANARERDDERLRCLSAFLRECRSRIDPAVPALGGHARRHEAVGSFVTPVEIADAAGINRHWYELTERGERTRATAAVLRALADVLALTPQQRALLTTLATPYFDREAPRAESLEMRDAFSSLRGYIRKLNACSTTSEVLSVVQETAASLFPEASYVTIYSRHRDGRWGRHGEATGTTSSLAAFAQYREEVIAPLDTLLPLLADELRCFPDMCCPGDLWTLDDQAQTSRVEILGKGQPMHERLHEKSIASVIRSRPGFVAQLYLADFRRIYDNDSDRALISAVVDFASLLPLE